MAIIVQAVVMMNLFYHNFTPPIPKDEPLAFQPIGDVLLIDYVLNSLALGGVDEAILFSCQDGVNIKDYIRDRVGNKAPWSLTMDVRVMMSETCQTMGDVMREIDAAAIIRGHFILTGINTITNINFATLLDQHMQLYKKDKDAAMTLVYKEAASEHPLINSDTSTFLAADGNTNKVLFHQKYQQQSQDKTINLPLEIVNHSGVKQHRNLIDTNIALCSPSVLHLFRKNVDFQTRDDFISALLINEKKLDSTLYYTLAKPEEYAAAITNWRNYEIIRFRTLEGDVLFGENSRRNTRDTKIRRFGDNVFTIDTMIGKRGARNVFTNSEIDASSNIGIDNVFTDSSVTKNSNMGDNNALTNSVLTVGATMGNKNVLTDSWITENGNLGDNNAFTNSVLTKGSKMGDNNVLTKTEISTNSIVGNNNAFTGCQIMNHVTIGNNVVLTDCNISNYHVIEDNTVMTGQILK